MSSSICVLWFSLLLFNAHKYAIFYFQTENAVLNIERDNEVIMIFE